MPEVIEGNWIKFDDPLVQFAEAIKFVGGVCTTLSSVSELPGKLAEFEQFRAAKRVFSAIPEVSGNVDLNETPDAHDLDNLDFVVYPGEFAVAENGAIWLTDRNLKHRVIFFITQFVTEFTKTNQKTIRERKLNNLYTSHAYNFLYNLK